MKTREQLKAQIDALNKSIEHWENNVAYSTVEDFDFVSIGVRECECCKKWFAARCVGCPVMERSGVRACMNTPYDKAGDIYNFIVENCRNKYGIIDINNESGERLIKEFKAAAQAELDFLRDIRNVLEVKLTSLNS